MKDQGEDEMQEQEDGPNIVAVIDARIDATTCPGCRVAVPVGQFCRCPMRWKG